MKFEKLQLKDSIFPIENVIALIRKEVIENASIHFEIDGANALFYVLAGEIAEEDLPKLAAICKLKE